MKKEKVDIAIVPDEVLASKIYFLRNQKIMLDRDLAFLYGVKPTRLCEQLKRNISKFPEHFMFQLSQKEVEIMVSHFAIPSRSYFGKLSTPLREISWKITGNENQEMNNTTERTATRDLLDLVEKGVIKSSGIKGAGAYYTLISNNAIITPQ
jgi:ORF6N domain